jgi:hypothetical protein
MGGAETIFKSFLGKKVRASEYKDTKIKLSEIKIGVE